MAKCSFCSKQIKQGQGIIFVEISGKIRNFCSRKCRRYLEMRRDPRKFKWAKKQKEAR